MTALSHLFVLGGARSGKSAYAERRARDTGLSLTYLATSQIFDAEMAERVSRHRSERAGDGWTTIEEPLALGETLSRVAVPGGVVLVDCLTLWVTNLMMAERDVSADVDRLVGLIEGGLGGPVIFVSNETGLGIVPDNKMARDFRDHAGRLNQRIAAVAGEVVFVAAGLALVLKPSA
ncbi:bifunctional adenosylcobinamide kinase/adenosylcobinamide-phosphate guanylyltransferase [Fulvimarina sp. 2208YS6-2-32]|uniref:Bifunctional adenosylcobalamin biosynthesis protein n=1 Tax=Fulvimarina uroteuthidis TaxID=3098149 RepID=A0ABU5I365_9HYPH|nr:bifunctional adenosylcobinamide kinase/adenosylcobinamide-phosphate guanylyltransferase [Fulvimarina sp. 2208YS6-2-32]MDY8109540.1 bifunctional adenosylcobinamide kinase/adenosylcobinamide-phosphate guanylyltransferase [Fulvimarina sp. 2208YS6-2-32]